MGPIPKELNLNRLIGEQLEQICIGSFDLQFRFMGESRIRGSGTVSVDLNGASYSIFGAEGWGDLSVLPKLVGRDVVSWRVESTHAFSIQLTDNAVIRFTSEDSPYENFIIDPENLVW